jgi:dCTP deaminase
MILTSKDIIKHVKNKNIEIEPFDDKKVGPNSYDVTLSNKIKLYKKSNIVIDEDGNKILKVNHNSNGFNNFKGFLDIKERLDFYEIIIPEEGLVIPNNELILGSTNEYAGSSKFIPMYEGVSSTGRVGLASHVTAGFGDIGFKGKWTLEIFSIYPIKIYPNMRIGQVFFYMPSSVDENSLYNGKYQSQSEVMESHIHKDFKN